MRDGFRDIDCPGIDAVDRCPTDDVPKLNEDNRGVVFLASRLLPILYDGFGGVNASAIDTIFRSFRVPHGERPFLLDKLLIIIGAVYKVQQTKRGNDNS